MVIRKLCFSCKNATGRFLKKVIFGTFPQCIASKIEFTLKYPLCDIRRWYGQTDFSQNFFRWHTDVIHFQKNIAEWSIKKYRAIFWKRHILANTDLRAGLILQMKARIIFDWQMDLIFRADIEILETLPKVLCKPHYSNSHLEMVVCKWGVPP